jgi:pimeloyl-ACP methyl ester carboxylesterase
MLQFRKYGSSPHKIVLVHGGPGAAGEMAPVAVQLACLSGVIEAFQTKMTIEEQVDELKEIIVSQASTPVYLIGFSWGAWLSILTASKYNNLVHKLILIGCGPLVQSYAAEVNTNRLCRLNAADRNRLNRIIAEFEQSENKTTANVYWELANVLSITDSYEPEDQPIPEINFNASIYKSIWPEAAELRESGRLLSFAAKIECFVGIIHGDYDPHPVAGVIDPLCGVLNKFDCHVLQQCGHKPWIEKHAAKEFYKILFGCISEMAQKTTQGTKAKNDSAPKLLNISTTKLLYNQSISEAKNQPSPPECGYGWQSKSEE